MNPFLLPDCSVISFSGGRTSAYMLRQHLKAFGGQLPPFVQVVFCNTGKERAETLEFVQRCSDEWEVKINWLEYDPASPHKLRVTDYANASRNGEPFEAVIAQRGYLPNPTMRFCTGELKLRTTNRFARKVLGWETYLNAIGLRADETKRVERIHRKAEVRIEPGLFGDTKRFVRAAALEKGETVLTPLADAGVTLADVTRFWSASPFDLVLSPDEGNCDLCFLKSAAKIAKLIEQNPALADWWARMESTPQADGRARTFRIDRAPYGVLKRIALQQVDAPGWLFAPEGQACGGIDECRCTD